MKSIILNIISFCTLLLLNSRKNKDDQFSGSFFQVKVRSENNNSIRIEKSNVLKTYVHIVGKGNKFTCEQSLIEGSQISINGKGNELAIGKGVKLRNANIIIRGTNCKIIIGDRTTFGGIRIVNVGSNNVISIGANCLFSDQIELWASDTHSILNERGEMINTEKPVHICENVWVGSGVTILKGVEIGHGSIIGMRSLVTKNVPPGVISAGIPSKTIKEKVSWDLNYPTSKV